MSAKFKIPVAVGPLAHGISVVRVTATAWPDRRQVTVMWQALAEDGSVVGTQTRDLMSDREEDASTIATLLATFALSPKDQLAAVEAVMIAFLEATPAPAPAGLEREVYSCRMT